MSALLQNDEDLDALNNQVIALQRVGKYAEAVPLAERYAEAMKVRHSADHPSYGAALNALAMLLRASNRVAEAEPLMRRVVAICESSYGPEHPNVATTLNNLALVLQDINRLTEAEPLMRRVVSILERRSGAEHPSINEALTNLAELLIRTNRSDEALHLLRRVLAALVEPLNARGPLPTDFRDLVRLIDTNQAAEAVPLMRRMLAIASAASEPLVLAAFSSAGSGASEAQEEEAKAERGERGRVLASLIPTPALKRPDPSTPEGALEIEAGRLAYQIPRRMWLGVQETVEVRLGPSEAPNIKLGFVGRGEIKTEDTPIVETMSVSLVCEPGAFDIERRSQEVQLVKPDLVKGTAFHQTDFGKWVWLVTPRERGQHTLLVKVSAAIKDSRGLPTTSSLPDKVIAVTVRVHLVRATAGALARVAPGLAWAVVTALVGVFTKDYWWPAVRPWLGM